MRQTLGVAIVVALLVIIGLAVRWLGGTGQKTTGNGKEMDPWTRTGASGYPPDDVRP
jgi:hypothetical protein